MSLVETMAITTFGSLAEDFGYKATGATYPLTTWFCLRIVLFNHFHVLVDK